MKFSKILLFFLSCYAFTSCSKVLDKKNLSAVSEKDVWNDLDLATAYVDRIYAKNLPEWSTEFATYSDEAAGGGSYLYGQLTEASVDYWPYAEIRDINTLIVNIGKGSLSDANKKSLKAQALFFRAFRYFELMKRYGGVPLVLEPQDLSDDLFVSRATTSATMKQIVADLDSAIAYLPAVSASNTGENNGRIHKGTAMAVKGRVMLYYASPQ